MKKIYCKHIITFLSVVTIWLLLCVFSPMALADDNVILLDAPLYPQETHYTCADASARICIGYYYYRGITTGKSNTVPTEQTLLSEYGKGSTNPIEKGLRDYNGISFQYRDKNSLSYFRTEIENSLLNGNPVVLNISLDSTSLFGYTTDGHYVVVIGMRQSESTELIINDPYHKNGYGVGQTIARDITDVYNVVKYMVCEASGRYVPPYDNWDYSIYYTPKDHEIGVYYCISDNYLYSRTLLGAAVEVVGNTKDHHGTQWYITTDKKWIKADDVVKYYIEDGRCTHVEEGGTLEVFENADIYSLPCNSNTDPHSQVIGSIGMPDMCVNVHANEVLTNSAGNYWYEINYGGRPGYIWSPHALLAYRNKATCTVYSMISLPLHAEPNANSAVTKTVLFPRWSSRTFNLYGYTWSSDRHLWYYTDGGYLDSDLVDTITITTSINDPYYSGTDIEQGENDPVSLTGYNIPDDLPLGTSFSVTGTLTSSDSAISSVTVGVYSANGTMIIGASAQPMAKSYDLSSLAGQVSFDQLGVGSYYYHIDASNSEGTFNIIDKRFSVYSDSLEQTYYSVYYHANGGTGAPETQTGMGGQAITLSNTKPVKDKWVFSGWSCDGHTYTPGETIILTSNMSMQAVWEPQIYSGTCGDNLAWSLNCVDGRLTITGSGKMTSCPWRIYKDRILEAQISEGATNITGNAFEGCTYLRTITLPSTLESVGYYAFRNCSSLTNLIIPDGVTSIETDAFMNCSSLTRLLIPATVTRIGISPLSGCNLLKTAGPSGSGCNIEFGWTSEIPSYAFDWCSSLTSVTIPNSITNIGDCAFRNCNLLGGITIPASVTNVGIEAFEGCDLLKTAGPIGSGCNIEFGWTTEIPTGAFNDCFSLTSVLLPTTVIKIGENAFNNCRNLTIVDLPSGLTSIGDGAFGYCESLTNIRLPDALTNIGENAFGGCNGFTKITIPSGVTVINYGTFSNCENLTSVTLSENVTSIGDWSFWSCSNLKSFMIPSKVEYIGEYAFSCCTSLQRFEVDSANLAFSSEDGVLFSKDKSTIICCPGGKTGKYVLPSSVTTIGLGAFCACNSLTGVTIPESVVTIIPGGEIPGCFAWCEGLKTAGPIGSGCDIEFGWKTTIPAYTFSYSYLESVIIPEGITSIGDYAFSGNDLTDVYYGGTQDQWMKINIGEGNDSLLNATIHYHEKPSGTWGDLNWILDDDGTLTISGNGPMDGFNSNSTSAWRAYKDEITSVRIESGVTSIGSYAFTNCTELTSVTLPEGLTSFDKIPFAGCVRLTSITIPVSVTNIYDMTFSGCNAVTDVYYGGTQVQWNAVTIGEDNGSLLNATIHFGGEVSGVAINETNFPDPVFRAYVIENCDTDKNGYLSDAEIASVTVIGVTGTDPLPEDENGGSNNSTANDNRITTLIGVKFFTSLQELYCDINQLTELDVSGLTALQTLYCSYNRLTELNVSGCTALQMIYCINNQLTELDVNDCTMLDSLLCYNNQLAKLDLSGCPELTVLLGSDNQLTELNVKNCSKLGLLECQNNQLSQLDISDCQKLIDTVNETEPTTENGITSYFYLNYMLRYDEGVKLITVSTNASGTWGDLSWTLDANGVLTISGSGAMADLDHNAADAWLAYKDSIISAMIEPGVTSIGASAFYRCSALESVTIPAGVTSIGSEAFGRCTALTNVTIPEGVTSIGHDAFFYCKALTDVVIPDSVKKIDYCAFQDCNSLTELVLPSGLMAISKQLFLHCSGLEIVTIPAGVASIGRSAFSGCDSLTDVYYSGTQQQWSSITIGSNNDTLKNAIIHCSDGIVFNFVLPVSLTTIEAEAFSGGAFSSVKLPETTTAIGSRAFADCQNLAYIYIPEATGRIARDAFEGVSGLTILGQCDSYAEFYAQRNGIAFVAVG